MAKDQFDVYLGLRQDLDDFWEHINRTWESELRAINEMANDIIKTIEFENKTTWYAHAYTKLTPYLVLDVEITAYNMGVVKHLKEIKGELIKQLNKRNVQFVKDVHVYYRDTLPGKGNVGTIPAPKKKLK